MANDNPPTGNKLLDNQVVRFIFSSGSGFLVDILAYYLFYHYVFIQRSYYIFKFHLANDVLSLAVSFLLGVMVNFIINKFFVFSQSKLGAGQQFFRFVLVAVVGFFANLAVLKLFVHWLGMYPPIARPLAALSLFFASFFVHKFFSFSLSLRHHHAPGKPNKASN